MAHGRRRAPSFTRALGHEIRIAAVQFGVIGRQQDSFSIEWEGDYSPDAPTGSSQRPFDGTSRQTAYLQFNKCPEDHHPRVVQIVIGGCPDSHLYRITIPMIEIKTMTNAYDFGQPYVMLELLNPPSFEMRVQHAPSNGNAPADLEKSWQRINHLNAAHERVVPFASRALCLVLARDESNLYNFIQMSKWSLLPRLRQSQCTCISSTFELFSRNKLDRVDAMVKKLPWIVGFQCEALLYNCLLNPTELLGLKPKIFRLNRIGTTFVADVLKLFMKSIPHIAKQNESVEECLDRAEQETRKKGMKTNLSPPPFDTFHCHHVWVTPTSFQLGGPEVEQSNCVTRFFGPEYNEYFLRVVFSDEGGSRFHTNFEVDNHGFVRERVGGILRKGLTIAGRRFSFLAYSSPGLRQHSVWFVAPFEHPKWEGFVTADAIRNSLESFSEDLPKWPSCLGARISQAFSFTYPSVDHGLEGRRICIRPSMKGFDARNSLGIEISEAFDTSIAFHLNRSLIMLLDNLGVQPTPFMRYLDMALEAVHEMLNTPNSSAKLMGDHGLGASYKIPLFLTRLEQYGLTALHQRDPFIRKLLLYANYHIKRELKYHARIPVPSCWTLVGVADVHDVLQEGEVYACIHRAGEEPFWLEGPVCVSRNPAVHLGDVRRVIAIGEPEPGIPYDIGDLTNCLVFSGRGRCPLSMCLGGDLDGDKYDIITVPELQPSTYARAALYNPLPQKGLDCKCTIDDIADFVVEFMNHDCIDLIAHNHLGIANQRPQGVRDADCMCLHPLATDFFKNEEPLCDLNELPRPARKPDWACSESEDPNDGDHYPSNRVLGVLFRHVELGSNPVEGPSLVDDNFRQEDEVLASLAPQVLPLIEALERQVDKSELEEVFSQYLYDLKYQCVTNNLQQGPTGRLTEEEVTLGTILARATSLSESWRRSDLMKCLERQATENVRNVEAGILGDADSTLELKLARAWSAYKMAYRLYRSDVMMGSRSFACIALNIVLDTLEKIEHEKEDDEDDWVHC
ncbi:hypothetical protein FRB99_007564 [Tulasnella sp. 403]|nr:hypothetical protein FRB99_007564 [Tulasnella sp. 403]